MSTRSAAKRASAPAEAPLLPRLPWTDFFLVLAISREASVAKACRKLGMTHATLLRKLDAIETRLRTRLFERVRGRYTLTAAGAEIESAARAFEPLARAAESRATGQDLRPSGSVRLSAPSIVLEHLLPPLLAQFAAAFPEVRIELTSAREGVSLRRREADVAIRVADDVAQWLVGRELGETRYRVYGRRLGRANVPLRPVEALFDRQRWIVFEQDARDSKFERWLAESVPEENVVLRVDRFNHAVAMVRAGLGICVLPEFIESSFADLQPLTRPIAALRTPLWLITHPELRNTARVRMLMRAFAPALSNALRRARA